MTCSLYLINSANRIDYLSKPFVTYPNPDRSSTFHLTVSLKCLCFFMGTCTDLTGTEWWTSKQLLSVQGQNKYFTFVVHITAHSCFQSTFTYLKGSSQKQKYSLYSLMPFKLFLFLCSLEKRLCGGVFKEPRNQYSALNTLNFNSELLCLLITNLRNL